MAKRYRDGEGTRGMLYCSFCGKTQNEVKKLVAGPSAVVAAVEPVGNSERSEELSTTPPPEPQKGAVSADPDRSIRL